MLIYAKRHLRVKMSFNYCLKLIEAQQELFLGAISAECAVRCDRLAAGDITEHNTFFKGVIMEKTVDKAG